LSETEPSADVAVFAGNRHKRFILSLVYSVIVGLAIPLLIGFPLAFLYLILAGLAFFSIAKAELNLTGQAQSLFQNQQTAPKDPFVRRIWSLNREAEYRVRQIEERWEKEASDKAFLARLDNLRNQKETYENLAQIRDFRLIRVAQGRAKDQFDEFLNGFVINHPDIAGIGDTAIAELLSQGVLTAADITEKRLGRIPGLNESRVRRLLEWRQELEKKFVFDPGKRVTPQSRIAIEKEIDSLRLRLEHELSCGARYLRRFKHEIETNRRKLQPALAKARRELAQAKKDLEVAGKRNSFIPILATLIIAFIIGLAISSSHESAPVREPDVIGNPREGSVVPPPPPPAVRPENKALDKRENAPSASDFYMQGMRFSSEEKFAKAVEAFRQAIKIDLQLDRAYVELGYALYRLKKYEESIDASQAAIGLYADFEPYYNQGLAYMALERWSEAKKAFESALTHRDRNTWKETHTLAYYYLAFSKTKLGEAGQAIEKLNEELKRDPKLTNKRLELGSLYLWVGEREAARAQYEMLRQSAPALADDLMNLMKKHKGPGVKLVA